VTVDTDGSGRVCDHRPARRRLPEHGLASYLVASGFSHVLIAYALLKDAIRPKPLVGGLFHRLFFRALRDYGRVGAVTFCRPRGDPRLPDVMLDSVRLQPLDLMLPVSQRR